MASEKKIDTALAMLSVSYPNYTKNANAMTRAVFQRILADVDDMLLESAVLQWLSTAHPFHPTPGELRDMCHTLIKADEPSAEEAWGLVKKAIRQYGSYRTPEFASETVAKTVAVMGWFELCMSENEEADRAHFWKIYRQIAERAKTETMMLPTVKNNMQQLKAAKVNELIGQTVKRLTSG